MTSWGPGIRDHAIDGLGTLLRRQVWRTSPYREQISATLTAALNDDNPVVRMNAAHAIGAVYVDATSSERIDVLHVLLGNETNGHVAETLVGILGNEVNDSPHQVDAVLSDVASRIAGWYESTRRRDSAEPNDSDVDTSSVVESDRTITLVTFLAVRHQTPFATETVDGWVSSPALAPQLLSAIPILRDFLEPQIEPGLQGRAFDLIREAATNALTYWTDAHDDSDRINEADLTAAEKTRLENALRTIDTAADLIYFASDAFNNRAKDESETRQDLTHEQLERFARQAVPVLLTCARSKAGPVIHHAVETLIHLAPLDERRSLTALAQCVTENANYAYDTLSAGAVVPYLTRLLTEQRDLVLYDPEGVEALRTLLSAYASAGDATALTLAFTLADVFR